MKKILSLGLGLLLTIGYAGNAFAVSPLANGSFEIGTDPGSYTTLNAGDSTSITNWMVGSGSVDYIGTYWPASDGTRSVDLNGLTTGSVSQAIPTDIGATYNVTFDMSGNPDSRPAEDPLFSPSAKVMSVNATGSSSQNFTYDTSVEGNSLSNMKWKSESYSFTATASSTTLTFASTIPGAFGPVLDNVAVVETAPAPVPAVVTNPATSITSSDATLNGTNGPVAGTGHSFWVSTSTFSTASPTIPAGVYSTQDMGGIGAGTPFSASLSTLTTSGVPGNLPAITPNTTYYFAAWSDVGGTWYPGAVLSFTTASTSEEVNPSVTTNSATAIGDTTATLNGTNGPVAADNTSFWWGTTSAGPFTAMADPTSEFPAGWSHDPGLGSAPIAGMFNEPLTGLTPGMTYYFVAWSHVSGIWYPGMVLQFTTSSPTACDANDVTHTIVSDATTQYNSGNSTVLIPNGAWVSIPGASWIWGTNGSSDNTTVPMTEAFTRNFSVTGTPISASISLSADNGYVLIVNGTTVDSQNVDPVNEMNYKSVHTYDISSYIHSGTNTLEVDVTNFGRPGTTFSTNPAGLIYSLTVNDNECNNSQPTPSVTTNPATATTTTTATLNGTNGPVAADNTSFWWGTTSAGPFTAMADPTSEFPAGWSHDPGLGSAPIAGMFNEPLTGLTPGMTYYFVAWSHVSGIWYPGLVLSFMTGTPTPTTGTISGMKYNDLNRNGKMDPGEPGLQGWVIRLISGDTVIATTTTDANGNYTFSNVAPGTYVVRETHQKGWKRQSKNPKPIVISSGSIVTDVNFGNAVIRKGEKEDTNGDDNRNDQSGKYYANHGRSDYGTDQNNNGHQQPDNSHGPHGNGNNH